MAAPHSGYSFWRIVHSDPPTIGDLLSNRARGRIVPEDETQRRLWDGISVYATPAQARRAALRFPQLGGYLARLDIPEDAPVQIKRTRRRRGHHTIWGEPSFLLDCVVEVVSA